MRTTRAMREPGSGLPAAARPAGGPGPGRPAGPPACDTGLDGVVRQAAARADQGDAAGIRAETFGPHLGTVLRPYPPSPRERQCPEAIERITSSLGWGSPVPRRDLHQPVAASLTPMPSARP
ncbi:hypothetical protein [Streptomyces sp. fd1-xmd]|uniref:hypothetical protein n=1 Tax=Streptomyces sp. fd1-xmd TaxID=1812480 RepID=UPI0013521018|nr:hypothetical protein [Streptomyces sp. fd1-xmd]